MKKGRDKGPRKADVAGADPGPSRARPGASSGGGARDADELLPEYDAKLIRDGVRGKYAERYAKGTTVVVLEPDVAAAFPDAAAVNAALRALLDIARRQVRAKGPGA
jgi:hypothetical protein